MRVFMFRFRDDCIYLGGCYFTVMCLDDRKFGRKDEKRKKKKRKLSKIKNKLVVIILSFYYISSTPLFLIFGTIS